MRDLRADMKKTMDAYSHNVVYVRRNLKFRCSCYSERSGEAAKGCPKCFGTSYIVRPEKIRGRRSLNSVPESLSGVKQAVGYGTMYPKQYVYYFEHMVQPKEGDLIFEVVWDESGKKPVRIVQRHVVSVAEPLFGDKGRTEFWTVYVKYDQGEAEDYAAFTKH